MPVRTAVFPFTAVFSQFVAEYSPFDAFVLPNQTELLTT